MSYADGSKSGGRSRGTPNKRTKQLSEFLDRVFARAMRESYVERTVDAQGGVTEQQWTLEDRLVAGILRGTLDTRELTTLLQYWAGRPAQAVNHKHQHTVTLEELITGKLPPAERESEDEWDGAPPPSDYSSH